MTAHPVIEGSQQFLIYFAHLEMRSLGKHSNPTKNNYMIASSLKEPCPKMLMTFLVFTGKFTENKKKLIKIEHAIQPL